MKASSRSRSTTSVMDFLRRHDGAAGLLPAAERMVRLGEDLRALLPPPLRDRCDVTAFDDGVVLVRVSSAGLAAKLRQTLPRLVEGLQRSGWQVSGIRARVQPAGAQTRTAGWIAPSATAIPAAGVAAFGALGRSLEHPALKAAVERLVRRRDARSGG